MLQVWQRWALHNYEDILTARYISYLKEIERRYQKKDLNSQIQKLKELWERKFKVSGESNKG